MAAPQIFLSNPVLFDKVSLRFSNSWYKELIWQVVMIDL